MRGVIFMLEHVLLPHSNSWKIPSLYNKDINRDAEKTKNKKKEGERGLDLNADVLFTKHYTTGKLFHSGLLLDRHFIAKVNKKEAEKILCSFSRLPLMSHQSLCQSGQFATLHTYYQWRTYEKCYFTRSSLLLKRKYRAYGEKYYTTINPSPELIRTHDFEFFI